MNIFLVGFMGSGKSTVGKILSQKTGLKFVDIDSEIEKKEKMSIKKIFEKKGEEHFRRLEKREIEEFTKKDGFIVSTGGGLGADPENMEKMKKHGIVVWLDVSLEKVLKRCGKDENRPILNQPVNKLKQLFENRKKVYSLAHIKLNTESKEPEKIAEEILELLNEDLHRN